MDLVAACRAFVHVGERGSFTLGAAAARVPQSVASRRVAALEEHLGERLFDRSARRAALTPFGRDMLPPARELVRLAEALEYQAERARLRPLGLAMPEGCPVRSLARLKAAGQEEGLELDFRSAGPEERARLVATAQVRAALVAVAPDDADWVVPLGAGSAGPADPAGESRPLRVDSLRPGRTQRTPRRIWIQPEDDVPHVRDHLRQLGHRAGLLPAQISVAASLVDAASAALQAGDLLLCSAQEAAELGLRYRALAGTAVARGYRVKVTAGDDPGRLRDSLGETIARVLGAPGPGGRDMSAELLRQDLRSALADAGLTGSFLVRDLLTGDEIGIDPESEFPVASLAKLPLAIAVAIRLDDGRLDGSSAVEVCPEKAPPAGPSGLSQFRHPARIAVDDLLYLSTAMSDNAAADALFDLVPPADVDQALRDLELGGISVRHPMRDLTQTPAEWFPAAETHLAHALAIGSRTPGRGHAVAQLDITRANTGSARAFADLLGALWTPSRIPPGAAARVRALMAKNVVRNRLAPDFTSDSWTWASKTGTLLNLRHEAGVVEHDDGSAYAVVALTESRVPAAAQPAAEAAMARVARALHDHLRSAA